MVRAVLKLSSQGTVRHSPGIMNRIRRGALFLLALLLAGPAQAELEFVEADVCVYGGTSAGIASAIQVKRMGKSVILLEPGSYLGGMMTSGLGATDIGNKAAIGGLAREFYQRVAKHYARDSAWKWEKRDEYFRLRSAGQNKGTDLAASDATMWMFEPHVADLIFADMLKTAGVTVYLNQRLMTVRKDKARISELVTEDAEVFRARVFIDATYEGDLMAKADVSTSVGRESNREYGETLNGIRAETPKHQFLVAVDPYVKPGDTNSGLLSFIQVNRGGKPGEGDAKVQAYNFRLCFTTNEANRLPIEPPEEYDPQEFELLARYIEALVAAGRKPTLSDFWHPLWLPNQKTDINNNGAFSTDMIGANHRYPEGEELVRARIIAEHEEYTRGFLTFLATSPRVPENIREEMKRWGPARDEFVTSRGWPRQLYIREARRMVSDYVMTENHCRGKVRADDAIGLAAYAMDSHNCQRVVKNGRVENEGDVQVPPAAPYPISYRAIIPKRSEAENLLVPVCLSASHIAYGSIRMEPVFMILGQSAATAAVLALDEKSVVQKVEYAKLRKALLRDGQVLEWPSGGGNKPKAR
jgi:ribulose 1,5-bisphosphate synthetase/thiazole synthase